MLRSKEEVEQLNIEVRRLVAWVDFDDEKIRSSTEKLRLDGYAYLAGEMDRLFTEHHHINDIHRCHLQKIYSLKGFSGSRHSAVHTKSTVEAEEEQEEDDMLGINALHLTETLDRMS
ncbi:hypothetical protein JVT61DRAFT_4278 [Boletus reticuloceps]|uniref:Uncharacterized protein n=1 Tax=Boletus reticuloceps TaxID=495285 RepID=A0A8I2YLT6_9AGAM|nr:hypothetical protein JVT61DRAFT_4278 [Boletus reticuloceps]